MAPKYGDVGCTTVEGTEPYSHELAQAGDVLPVNTHIYGPFEAGFGERQRGIIEGWGCTDPTSVYDEAGGIGVDIAERKVAYVCNVQLPRFENGKYIGFVAACG